MEGSELNCGIECNSKTVSKQDIKILALFDVCRRSTKRSPKKEYLRCKLIRGHKRSIRQIFSGKIPKTTIHKFDQSDQNANTLWSLMKQINTKYPSEFQETSKTESGPKTDGKSKRQAESQKVTQNSFNQAFCKSYFERASIRESFSLYIDLIFSNFEPGILCGKFEFRCCRSELHSTDCLEKWVGLYQYVKIEMIKELGWEPYDCGSTYITLPSYIPYIEDID